MRFFNSAYKTDWFHKLAANEKPTCDSDLLRHISWVKLSVTTKSNLTDKLDKHIPELRNVYTLKEKRCHQNVRYT